MIPKDLPGRYRFLRANKNLSISKLATELGCNPKTISFYENGDREMPRGVLIKYADYFEVTTDFLLGRTNDPDPKPSAVDDLKLSKKAVEVIKEYSPVYQYKSGPVFNILLEHEEFIKIIEVFANILEYADRVNAGTSYKSNEWDVSEFLPMGIVPDILEKKYNKSFEEVFEYFGTLSGIIGGKHLLEYKAFKAKKAFDIILQSIINRVTSKYKGE